MVAGITHLLPRWLLVITAEISGVASITAPAARGLTGVIVRIRALFKSANAGLGLFDCAYYLDTNPDVRASKWPPLVHFLTCGGFEGRKPHPLFDPAWYVSQHSDVASSWLNPLQHFLRFGGIEGRSPHPLFDAAWYFRTYPDVKATRCNPLLHFLAWGAAENRLPHPLFDTGWYKRTYPEVEQSGLNPLIHYVLRGWKEALNPNSRFNTKLYLQHYPRSVAGGRDPLSHFVMGVERGPYNPHPFYPVAARRTSVSKPQLEQGLILSRFANPAKAEPVFLQQTIREPSVAVFVVYGPGNVTFIENNLIPALAAQYCRTRLHLHVLNYRSGKSLLSERARTYACGALSGVTDWSEQRDGRHIGFGEGVNQLFDYVRPETCFFLVNPDSLPMPGCMDVLLNTFSSRPAALVEARQWPSEHPKEYDPETGWTPWASGAFLLISSIAFRRLNGFDPVYFLYNEDVDLSWRAWLSGMPVVYEPAAMCAHFTGALSYANIRFYYEHFFSIRNSLVIAYKFFGPEGEAAARCWIDEANLPAAFRELVERSYRDLRSEVRRIDGTPVWHADKVKILGLNLYHRLRPV